MKFKTASLYQGVTLIGDAGQTLNSNKFPGIDIHYDPKSAPEIVQIKYKGKKFVMPLVSIHVAEVEDESK